MSTDIRPKRPGMSLLIRWPHNGSCTKPLSCNDLHPPVPSFSPLYLEAAILRCMHFLEGASYLECGKWSTRVWVHKCRD
ncbi:hypothetical protein CY35_05G041700 [Sphagnum magellanicum]|nr:hypothetical protein CY35_05G041700 [Sphagnum magellanicum]